MSDLFDLNGQVALVTGASRGLGKETAIALAEAGADIRRGTLKSLRGQIGMVTPNVVTFNDTIAANIAYGRPAATR